VQAVLYRIEALQQAIPTRQQRGRQPHTWLDRTQVRALLDICGDDLVGRRDRLVLGLLVGAGLRRRELADLCFDDVKRQPLAASAAGGDPHRVRTILAMRGKGAKDRVVPICGPLAEAIERWGGQFGHRGHVVRSLGRHGQAGARMSPVAIFNVVRKHGALIGQPTLAPHDLRRTYAQLGYQAGVPLTQISRLLGHASLTTTQRYLNLDLDLDVTVSDFIPF